MNDIIDEINREIREDRGRQLWKKYGAYVIGLGVAIVLFVSGFQGYKAYDANIREQAAQAYVAALDAEDSTSLRNIADQGGEGYPMLARFALAGQLATAGDTGAEAEYLLIANDSNIAEIYRRAALLLSVLNAGSDTSSDEKIERLNQVIAEDSSEENKVWRKMALELLISQSLAIGDVAKAKQHLTALKEEGEAEGNIDSALNQRLLFLEAALGE